jgi:uncharacterized protein YqgC (DUF456 family)
VTLATAGDVALAILAWTVHLLFAVAGAGLALTVLVGLPGAWMLIALALVIELADGLWLPAGRSVSFGWWPLGVAVAIAAAGELAEFLAGAVGARRAGSTRAGAIGAVIGGLVGAILGIPVPPPVLGSLVCSILGTFVGAILGELTSGARPPLQGTLRPATGATIGRILGTLAKVPAAAAAWAILVGAGLVRLVIGG